MDMTKQQKAVLDLIKSRNRTTQAQIAEKLPFLGPHKDFELNAPSKDSTTRKVRSIINSLRNDHGCPILEDTSKSSPGYYLADKNSEEARAFFREVYLPGMRRRVKARILASLVTLHSMEKNLLGESNPPSKRVFWLVKSEGEPGRVFSKTKNAKKYLAEACKEVQEDNEIRQSRGMKERSKPEIIQAVESEDYSL